MTTNIDRKTLDQAREWAEWMNNYSDVFGGTTARSRAAAEVIRALPDSWVDGDKLQEQAINLRALHHSLDGLSVDKIEGIYFRALVSVIGAHANMLEVLLTDPKTASPRPDGCCGACPETVGGEVDCTCADNPRCPNYRPRPEDVPVGEVWKVEVYGETAVGFRNDPEDRWPWCVTYQVNSRSDWLDDNAVKLIARLVPETTEQNEEPDIDPDCIYIDRDGDKWEYIDGGWITGDTHANRVANRELSPGRDSLPEWFGPYTRIEKGTNE